MDLEVHVSGLGRDCVLAAAPTWTIRELKAAIEAAAGVPARELRLLAGDAEPRALARLRELAQGAVLDLRCLRRSPEQAEWLEAVAEDSDGDFLAEAPPHICADREVVMAAVLRNGRSLEYASDALRADRELALTALEEDSLALRHVAGELWADKTFVLAAVERNPLSLKQAIEELRADPEVVRRAVERNGLALQHAAEHLRADRSIVLAAVEETGDALRFADPELRRDSEVVEVTRALDLKSTLAEDPRGFRTCGPRPRAGHDVGVPFWGAVSAISQTDA